MSRRDRSTSKTGTIKGDDRAFLCTATIGLEE